MILIILLNVAYGACIPVFDSWPPDYLFYTLIIYALKIVWFSYLTYVGISMYLLSPKVMRLGTKGSENSENVLKTQLKIIIEIN